jgi:hypothetical protein
VSVGEVASRVGKQVYHTGQGQDERARTRPSPLLRGLDSAWSVASNPHRESGTRWWAAADVGPAGRYAGAAHGRQKGRAGNRLGDSVGARASCTGEEPRSAGNSSTEATSKRGLASGDVLARSMRKPRRLKGRGLIARVAHPHAIDDAHPDIGQGPYRHRVAFALRPLALIVVQSPGLLPRRLPSELMQGVAQRLDTGIAAVGLEVGATLKQDRRGACQRLQTGRIGIALAVIPDFRQQARGYYPSRWWIIRTFVPLA